MAMMASKGPPEAPSVEAEREVRSVVEEARRSPAEPAPEVEDWTWEAAKSLVAACQPGFLFFPLLPLRWR